MKLESLILSAPTVSASHLFPEQLKNQFPAHQSADSSGHQASVDTLSGHQASVDTLSGHPQWTPGFSGSWWRGGGAPTIVASSCISDASLGCTNLLQKPAGAGWRSAALQHHHHHHLHRLTWKTAAAGRRAEFPAGCSLWNLWTKDTVKALSQGSAGFCRVLRSVRDQTSAGSGPPGLSLAPFCCNDGILPLFSQYI